MISKLKIQRHADHTPLWYEARHNGIGSSESGTVLGLNEYQHPVELFYNKIVPHPIIRQDNSAMLWGRLLEDKVADMWKFWDGTEEGYILRFNEGKELRDLHRVNGIITNPDFPYMLTNVDRVSYKDQVSMITGEVLPFEFPVEVKTMNKQVMDKWEEGLPPYHICQLTHQMITLEVDYGEFAIFDNYRKFLVFPVVLDEDFAEYMKDELKHFWYDRVLPAREIVKKHFGDQVDDFTQLVEIPEIQQLEPQADDGNDKYRLFWSEQYAKKENMVEAKVSETFIQAAENMKTCQEVEKAAKEWTEYYKNVMVEYMKNNDIEVADMGSNGKVKWTMRKNSERRGLYNYGKFDIDKESIKEQVSKITP